MIDKNNIELREYVSILNTIRRQYPNAIIAGGSLRDLTLGSWVKDVDIFVHTSRSTISEYSIKNLFNTNADNIKVNTQSVIASTVSVTGTTQIIAPSINTLLNNTSLRITQSKKRSTSGYMKEKVKNVFNVDINGIDVQIIVVSISPDVYVRDHFDFGICKVYTDGRKVTYLPDFIKDVENETITYCERFFTEDTIQYAISHHFQRIHEKYPSYKLRYAEHIPEPLRIRNYKTC